MTCTTLDQWPSPETASAVQSGWEKVNVHLEYEFVSFEDNIRMVVMPKLDPSLPPFDRDSSLAARVPQVYNAGMFLPQIALHSKGPTNVGTYVISDSPIDAFYDEAIAAVDEGEADVGEGFREAMWEFDRYVHDEALIIPLYELFTSYGMRTGVHFTPYLSEIAYVDEAYRMVPAGE